MGVRFMGKHLFNSHVYDANKSKLHANVPQVLFFVVFFFLLILSIHWPSLHTQGIKFQCYAITNRHLLT